MHLKTYGQLIATYYENDYHEYLGLHAYVYLPVIIPAALERRFGYQRMKTLVLNTLGDDVLEQIQTLLPISGDEVEIVDTSDLKIAHCAGCNQCWLKTPGVCAFKDDYEENSLAKQCLPPKWRRGLCTVYYDEDTLIGLSYVFIHKDIAYLGYLAVEENLRNQGYGSKILQAIRKELSDCRIVIDIEVVDKNAENYEERVYCIGKIQFIAK